MSAPKPAALPEWMFTEAQAFVANPKSYLDRAGGVVSVHAVARAIADAYVRGRMDLLPLLDRASNAAGVLSGEGFNEGMRVEQLLLHAIDKIRVESAGRWA